MDLSRLVKIVVVIAILAIAWKVGLPWIRKQGASSTASVPGNDCVRGAEHASEAWGNGIGRFVNPPYDMAAWSAFKDDVDASIRSAESGCSCADQSCTTALGAVRDLRTLVAEFDSAIRSGSPAPDDAVQRQESIDNRIQQADELRRSGK